MTSLSTRPLGAVVAPLLVLAACTSNPIAPVSDFDFVFEEIQAVNLGEEPDTSTVEIYYEPAPEDTTYLETQEGFLADARSAPLSGSVPPTVVTVAEAAHVAFDEATSTQLSGLAEQASADPAAFVAHLRAALEDSSTAAFATYVTDVARQQATLAALLGIAQPATSATSASVRGAASPEMLFGMQGTSSCVDDAQLQTQQKLDAINEERADREIALQRALQRSIAAADTFRVAQIRGLAAESKRRTEQAEQFLRDAQGAIETLVQNGLITQVTATDLRIVSITVVLTRLNESRKHYVSSEAGIHAAADAAIAAAQDRYDQQSMQLRTSFDLAVGTLQQLESIAVLDCHDQGTSNG